MSDQTTLLERPDDATAPDESTFEALEELEEDLAGGGGEPVRRPPVALVALAGLLASSGAAWAAGNLLRGGLLPEGLALLGAMLGAGLVGLGHRTRRPAVLGYLVLPTAALVGALFVAPAATGGSANLLNLVGEAVKTGGLRTAPIAFDPGWRFILVVFFAAVSASAVSIAITTGRAKLAVLVPVPVLLGAALLQPKGSEVLTSAVAFCLVIAALGVAYGADLRAEGGFIGGEFELRRLLRGAGLVAVLLVGVVLLARTDALFPDTQRDPIIPPQKPPKTQIEDDRPLFGTPAEEVGPWRVGVLDVYDGEAWLLPPFDPARFVEVPDGRAFDDTAAPAEETREIEVTIYDIRGRQLPVPGGTLRLQGTDTEFDPRTQVPGLESRVPQDLTYTVEVRSTPTTAELDATAAPPKSILDEFTDMPMPPPAVVDLLRTAPQEPFTRLQFLRDALYRNVIAAGAGSPTDISPERVAEMLQPDTEANPFEITAAEAMLARWAGVPARIGFGYYRGEPEGTGFTLRPKHGAAWLEAYFDGYGWVPLVGTPPQARSSLNPDETNENANVRPSDELALLVYIPVQERSLLHLFEIMRYWLLVSLPIIAALVMLVVAFPWLVKLLRSRRRSRWAMRHGAVAQLLTEYAEFRDRCLDMNLGAPDDTPLRFVRRFDADAEHAELGWLVTRGLWGDLRRDLRKDDIEEAARLTRSVFRRIAGAQPPSNRFAGAVAWASLRDPYTDQVPNLRPRLPRFARMRRAIAAPVRSFGRGLRRLRFRKAATASLLLLTLGLGGCAQQGGFDGAEAPVAYPERIAPEQLLGLTFVREEEAEVEYEEVEGRPLVTDGRVYTIRDDLGVQGSLQVARLLPELDGSDPEVQAKISEALGGAFVPHRIGTIKLQRRVFPEQFLYLWFPPERNVMVVFAVRSKYERADELVTATIAYQRGLDPDLLLASSTEESS